MRALSLIALLLAIAPASAVPLIFTTNDHTNARRFLDVEFTNRSGAIVIGLLDRNGSRVFAKGTLDNGTGRKADADTLFELGSITKVFTALLALDLERRGEWNLNDPVSRHLPRSVQVPRFDGQPITLGNLARQDSGLPRFPDNLGPKPLGHYSRRELKKFSDAYGLAAMFEYLRTFKLTEAPGTRFVYSNTGMALLGHAIERRLKLPYAAAVRQRITEPLNMSDTGIRLSSQQQQRLAIGHYADGSKAENIRFVAMAPAGSLLSSVNDMLRFVSVVLGFHESELKPLCDRMCIIQHTGSTRFGRTGTPWLGDGVYNPPGSNLLGHGGGGFGYLAFVGFDTLKRRGVVVLTSQMNWSPEGIGWSLLQGLPLTRFNVSTGGPKEVIGLGVALRPDAATGCFRINRVFPRSPAGRAGLRAGEILGSVNGVDVRGMSLQECLALLGGSAGSRFAIEISEAGQTKTRTISLVRQKFLAAD